MKEKKEIIGDAIGLLRDVGWCQGVFRQTDDGGNLVAMCALGALKTSAGYYDRNFSDEEWDFLWSVIEEVKMGLPNEHMGLAAWNDNHERTKEDVIALLTLALEKQS